MTIKQVCIVTFFFVRSIRSKRRTIEPTAKTVIAKNDDSMMVSVHREHYLTSVLVPPLIREGPSVSSSSLVGGAFDTDELQLFKRDKRKNSTVAVAVAVIITSSSCFTTTKCGMMRWRSQSTPYLEYVCCYDYHYHHWDASMIVDVVVVVVLVPSQHYYQVTVDNVFVFLDNADISNQLYAIDIAVICTNTYTNTNTNTNTICIT